MMTSGIIIYSVISIGPSEKYFTVGLLIGRTFAILPKKVC